MGSCFTALVINLVVAIVLTAAFRMMRLPAGADETQPAHYPGRGRRRGGGTGADHHHGRRGNGLTKVET